MNKDEIKAKLKSKIDYRLGAIVFALLLILIIWCIALKFNFRWIAEDRAWLLKNFSFTERILKDRFSLFDIANRTRSQVVELIVNYILNTISFLPIGAFPYLFISKKIDNKRTIAIVLSIAVAASFTFEIIQAATGIGGFDGSDILFNFLGSVLGILIVLLIKKISKDNFSFVANTILIVLFCLSLPVALFCIINTGINYQLYIPPTV